MGSGVELIEVTCFFEVDSKPTDSFSSDRRLGYFSQESGGPLLGFA